MNRAARVKELKTGDVEEKVRALAGPVVESLGLELVDVAYVTERGRAVLRVYIDSPTGVTIDDCVNVSRELGAILDVEDPVRGRYSLEVSSPGLNRVLKREKDFLRFVGKKVKIRTVRPLSGRRNFTGIIKGVEDGKVSIVDSKGQKWTFPLEEIDRASLVVEI